MAKNSVPADYYVVKAEKSKAYREPMPHQKNAIKALDVMNKQNTFKTLIVIPTGGGKTFTASRWLIQHALDEGKKVLWLAHRNMLLNQAADSFANDTNDKNMTKEKAYKCRIISGDTNHSIPVRIEADDNLLIVSKDSLGRGGEKGALQYLDKWLANEKEIFLVIDEAHHATAKTYRKIIKYVEDKISNFKLIGLTATPFRTSEKERGWLSQIFTDGIENGKFVHNSKGYAYEISLKELISRKILAAPVMIKVSTKENYSGALGLNDIERIQHFDALPDDIVQRMVKGAARNKLIVDTYKQNQQLYGQTIVFVYSIEHAIELNKYFKEAGIKSDYVVSSIRDSITGVDRSKKENEAAVEGFRNKQVQVLINVNILTEGVDLPQTQTVFLVRPTISKTLMTQMVGRALRGTKAGGTEKAYIVSFIDQWDKNISWVNPDTIFDENATEIIDTEVNNYVPKEIRYIAVSLIENFAAMLNGKLPELKYIPWSERFPVGMYSFTYINREGQDETHQIMVYSNTVEKYKCFVEKLPVIFKNVSQDDEYLPEDVISRIERECKNSYFTDDMIPAYDEKDICSILRFYAQNEVEPSFISFDKIQAPDITEMANCVIYNDYGPKSKVAYLDKLWNDEDSSSLRAFFSDRKSYFYDQVDAEVCRIMNHCEETKGGGTNVLPVPKSKILMTMNELKLWYPEEEKELRNKVFNNAIYRNKYVCNCCGKYFKDRRLLQIDHIKPMSKGGVTEFRNLQVLCRSCNAKKSDM